MLEGMDGPVEVIMFEKTNIEKLYKYGMKVQVKKDTYLYNACLLYTSTDDPV